MIVAKAVKMAEMMDIPVLGLIENMSYMACPTCGEKINIFGESHLQQVAADHGLSVIAQLPIDPELAQACDKGKIELNRPGFFITTGAGTDDRSEERRVGKECRSRWSPYH